ncbi:5'-3' exoribonuclease 4 [Abeliophyllum distichum]|uniref:5'-3' exoribonuclease n=1 Tax=Abeliophyllum distichum TaxID=126358 RepID=A0ABD1VYE2_9LAMI
MGIPSFYRWLIERYPRSVVEVIEDSPAVINGVKVPIDTTKPNPNGFEFDNLYLDMNGIIHPCFHPEDMPMPETYNDVFRAVFKYIDRIFNVIRPRKLLYMAIDGVAPRAKMNQQRARRFRAATDVTDEASQIERLRGDGELERNNLGKQRFDSNVITPGTEFMELLSSALQYYVHWRTNRDPGWQSIKVILSDASVPGEGEHKIMSYIRLQRNLPGFDPNTRHCLYGLDADLIMLGLATHEVHFSVLREDVQKAPVNYKGPKRKRTGGSGEALDDFISRQKFQFLNVWVLREYLAESLRIPDPSVKVDLERLIDDFVFMCLFVGNDFLPHVPSLEISEGAIDLLMVVYKNEFVRMGGYLIDSFEVNLERVEHFVRALGTHENAIFRKRRQEQMGWKMHAGRVPASGNSGGKEIQIFPVHVNAKARFMEDKVNLGEEGWKERYYTEKFKASTDDDRQRVKRHAVLKYVEGICWVMHYYYQGVCSWQWFYPYHYAPFASDFQSLNELKVHFALGKPFKPFNQLMGVLPAASAHALPLFYRKLMKDPSSPILDFYPIDFELDMNGRKHAWKAVCRLPFIDECRLLAEIAKVEHTLTDEENQRNSLGMDKLYVHDSHPLASKIFAFFERNKDNPKLSKAKVKKKINPKFSGGMNGYMYLSDKPICPAVISSPICDMEMIMKNKVISVFYNFPSFHPHMPKPPEGVIMPGKFVSRRNFLPPPVLWHEKTAIQNRFSRRPIPPKSVAGPCLARLAHQLVSGNCVSERPEDMGVNGVDHGKLGKRSYRAPDDNKKNRKKRNKRRKLNKS